MKEKRRRSRGELALEKGEMVNIQKKSSTVLEAEERSRKMKIDKKHLQIGKVTDGFRVVLNWGAILAY